VGYVIKYPNPEKFIPMLRYLVFTDLDGILLDPETYSYQKSLAAINRLKENEIEQCRYQGKEGRWK